MRKGRPRNKGTIAICLTDEEKEDARITLEEAKMISRDKKTVFLKQGASPNFEKLKRDARIQREKREAKDLKRRKKTKKYQVLQQRERLRKG